MEEEDAFVQVQVLVPRSRVAEFYVLVGQWLSTKEEPFVWPTDDSSLLPVDPREIPRLVRVRPTTTLYERPTQTSGAVSRRKSSDFEFIDQPEEAAESWTGRWNEKGAVSGDTLAAALNVYSKLSLGAKRFIDALLERPGEKVSSESLAKQLEISQAQLTGTLASVSIRSKAVRREVPFGYMSGPDGGYYWIESDVATLFSWARTQPAKVIAMAAEYDEQVRLSVEQNLAIMQMAAQMEPEGPGFEIPQEMTNFSLILSSESIAFQLDQEFRRATNQPLLEDPVWLRAARQAAKNPVSKQGEEAPMTTSE